MADNLTTQSATPATVPASTVIATDDAGAGGHVQIVKLAISTDGSATALTADNTDGLLVNLGTNNDITGTVTANLAAGTNNIGDVDVLTIPAPLSTTGGGTEATALRVTVANDSTGVLSVDDNGGNLSIDDGGNSITVDNAGTFAVQASQSTASSLNAQVVGNIAHDGVDSGNPVKIGAKAVTNPSTATMVANADRSDLITGLDGALHVRDVPLPDVITEAVSDTAGTSTAFTNFGATASTRNYITAITAFRTDAGTSMAYIDIRDGTAGSVLYRIPLPPTGGVTLNNGGSPLLYSSANTALAYDVSSALTTVYISVTGFKSKARA